jgi:hypothetical protein
MKYVIWMGVVFVALLTAQDFRATLNGVVHDSSGAVIPGAKLEVKNVETGVVQQSTTLTQGDFTVPFLRPGTYTVAAEAAGFKKVVRENIILRQGQAFSVTLVLEPGSLSEQITVTAETPLLETEKADRGTVIDNARITEFPITGRNPIMLTQLVPGVAFRGGSARAFDNGSINNWRMNGSPDRSSEFLLDGAPNNSQAGGNNVGLVPSADAVEEFRVHTNIYDAQYGKTGGGIISITLKSGANEFHGTAFDFMRRGAWTANSFQNNRNGAAKGNFREDQIGGVFSGPVRIPKLYDGRNRSFFMLSYEDYYLSDPSPFTGSVPAQEFLDGDFSKLDDAQGRKIVVYDPNTGRMVNNVWTRDPFASNLIPKDRINPISRKILGYLAQPNRDRGPGQGYSQGNLFQPGGLNNWKDDFYNLAAKVDHNLNASQRMFFRYATNSRIQQKNTTGIMDRPGEGESQTSRVNQAFTADWVGSLRPTVLANLRVSFNRFVEEAIDPHNYGFDITQLGFPKSVAQQLPNPSYFGVYTYAGYTGQGMGGSLRNITNNFAIHPNLTWIRSSHTFKFGVDYRWVQYATLNPGSQFVLNSTTGFTQRDYLRGDTNPSTGNSIASFLLGMPASGGAEYRAKPFTTTPYVFPYIQDDWKVTPKLTLNLGFRMDFTFPPTERFDRLNRGFDGKTTNPVNSLIDRTKYASLPELKGGMLFAGVNGVPRRAADVFMKTFQPRVGVAYRITDKIVFRGGYGRAYMNAGNGFIQTNGFSFNNQAITTPDGGRTARAGIMNDPFPSGVLLPPGAANGLQTFLGQGFTFVSPDYRLPHIDQFSAGFQFRLPGEGVLDVSYVGSRAKDLEGGKGVNEIDLATRQSCNILEGGSPSYCQALLPNPFAGLEPFRGTSYFTSTSLTRANLSRPYPHFGGLTQGARPDGRTWYNSLQISYETRRRGGLNAIVSYTLSKMMEQSGWADLQKGIMQRQLAVADTPHRLTAGVVYALPFGPGQRFPLTSNGFLKRVVGGWETNAILTVRSGEPLAFSGNVWYVKDARLPNVDRSAEVVRALQPCVARWNDNGTISMLAYSQSYGCTDYNFLIMPSYATSMSPARDGRLRSSGRTNVDFSLNKTTAINERVRVQFRAEAYNLSNTPGRPSINMDPANVNFGTALRTNSSNGSAGTGGAGPPRNIQLGIKVLF